MNAQEMFEKLGYKKEETKITKNGLLEEHTIDYKKEHNNIKYHFRFDLIEKEYKKQLLLSAFNIPSGVTLEELKAVIQFYKELGWIK